MFAKEPTRLKLLAGYKVGGTEIITEMHWSERALEATYTWVLLFSCHVSKCDSLTFFFWCQESQNWGAAGRSILSHAICHRLVAPTHPNVVICCIETNLCEFIKRKAPVHADRNENCTLSSGGSAPKRSPGGLVTLSPQSA